MPHSDECSDDIASSVGSFGGEGAERRRILIEKSESYELPNLLKQKQNNQTMN